MKINTGLPVLLPGSPSVPRKIQKIQNKVVRDFRVFRGRDSNEALEAVSANSFLKLAGLQKNVYALQHPLFHLRCHMSIFSLQKKWEQLKPKVSHLYKPALKLFQTDEVTQIRLGGKPVTDASFQWPCVDGEPLAFLAQIDLVELTEEFNIDWLPETGSLLFFYDVEAMPWGGDVEDKDSWKVIYQKRADTEIKFPRNLEGEFRFDTVYLKAVKSEQLPSLERDEAQALNLSEAQQDTYYELGDREFGDQPSHQVSGYPDCVQNDDMELECQLLERGINLDDASVYESDTAKALLPEAENWGLLLQLDTDEDAGMMWGDCGMLYFWVKKQEARESNFDNVRMILQCY